MKTDATPARPDTVDSWLTGSYFRSGRHTSEFLEFTDEGHFRYRKSHWMSDRPDFLNGIPGHVHVDSNGVLILRSALAGDPPSTPAVELDLVPVAWGERHYLIEADEMPKFCKGARGTDHPLGRIGLLRSGDETRTVTGRPDVPARYRRYLRAQPIEARVVEIINSTDYSVPAGGWVKRESHLLLNVGDADGVMTEDVFVREATAEGTRRTAVVVTEVRDHSCVALAWQFAIPPRRIKDIEIGWKFSLSSSSPTRLTD